MDIMNKNQELKIFTSPQDLFYFAARDFAERAKLTVANNGRFSVVLSGGNTPKAFFNALTEDQALIADIPWQSIHFFFGDERYVPATDVKSNYFTAYENLFSKVPIDPNHIHAMPTTNKNPQLAAVSYEKILRQTFAIDENSYPIFDLIYLGLGDNAHTASLMPLTDLVVYYAEDKASERNTSLAAALFDENSKTTRITLTPNAINHANNIIFLVTGADKARAVANVLENPGNAVQYPAQLIQSVHGSTAWFLDEAAAEGLHDYGR
jgi:6-phosphogluconolactonase